MKELIKLYKGSVKVPIPYWYLSQLTGVPMINIGSVRAYPDDENKILWVEFDIIEEVEKDERVDKIKGGDC